MAQLPAYSLRNAQLNPHSRAGILFRPLRRGEKGFPFLPDFLGDLHGADGANSSERK